MNSFYNPIFLSKVLKSYLFEIDRLRKINDEELLAQLKAIKDLPDNDKKVVKELINAFLIKNKIQTLVK